MFKCLVCGETVSIRFPLCSKCNRKYPYKDWEKWPWLSELWKDEKKYRYRAMKIKAYEVDFCDCTYSEKSSIGIDDD